MDLLVTVIGNAVADPAFRTELLKNPRAAVDEWGFRLTKGEVRILDAMFTKEKAKSLNEIFDILQGQLIEGIPSILGCTKRQCPGFGCYPPPSQEQLRRTLDELSIVA